MLQNCNAGKKLLSEKVLFPASRFDHQDTIFCLKIILMTFEITSFKKWQKETQEGEITRPEEFFPRS